MQPLEHAKGTPSKMRPIIRSELTEELYRHFPTSIFATVLIATVLFWELSKSIGQSIAIWYYITCFILFSRLGLMYWYRHTKKNRIHYFLHYYLFVLGSSLTALLWGILGSVLMPNDLAHQLFVLIIISGVLAGSVQSLSASFFSNMLYILLTLLPILFWEFTQIYQGVSIFLGIFVLMTLYCFYSLIIARRSFIFLLSNIEMRDFFKRQATHDLLTGLFNPLYLEEYLKLELNKSKRNNSKFSLILLDIDNFKLFNYNYGPQMGDDILKNIGTLISKNIRSSDMACRYGEDEFLIVFPEMPGNTAAVRSEHINALLKKLKFTSPTNPLEGLTFSFGISVYPEHGLESAAIIESAKKALKQAKKEGGNRICLA